VSRTRLIAALTVLSLVAAGCGGDDDGRDVVSETAAKLGQIRSGELLMRIAVKPTGAGAGGGTTTVELRGPFARARAGALPVFRVSYRQSAGKESAGATVISSGRRAYVEVRGTAYRLTASQAGRLRSVAGGKRPEGFFGLDIGGWLNDPELSDGPEIGGVETDRVRGEIDAVAALEDLQRAAAKARGAGEPPKISDEQAKRVRAAIRDSSVELITGADDRLLRRLRASLELEAPEDLRPLLGGLRGGRVELTLAIDRLNEPVRVTEPAASKPFSALPAARGR
jgi:hypothetical protein